jgi:translocation and assembly module TamB
MNQPLKKKSFGRRLTRIVLKTILFLFLFVVLVILLILTPPVQNMIRKKAVVYLENKLNTKVEIGRIYVGFPKKVVLENFYIEDRQKDTLLAGELLKADIGLYKLIFHSEIDINSIQLKNITAKIKRQLPDTAFNYQFIVDAFAPPKTDTITSVSATTATASTSPALTSRADAKSSSSIAIRNVTLDKARIVYKDVITGNDAEAWIDHFDTKVDKIDPDNSKFDIPRVNIKGMTARVYQSKPLLTPDSTDTADAGKPPVYPELVFDKVDLEEVNIDYRNDVSALYTSAAIGDLAIQLKQLDFMEQVLDFTSLSLANTTAALRLGRKEEARELAKKVEETADSSIERGWRVIVSSFSSENNLLKFDNDNEPRQKTGMDYAHISANPFNLQVKNFRLSDDTIAGKIEKASFKEQSGFELQELRSDVFYSNHQAWLHGLYLKTPGTELQRDAELRYASLETFQRDIGNLILDIDIEDSKVLVKDVLTFAPMLRSQPAFADPSATWYINSRITGRVADLDIAALQVQGLQDTRIDVSGRITGLPAMNTFNADLTIRNVSSSRRDINKFLPASMMPQQVTLPSRFNMSGSMKGNTRDLNTALAINTDLGNAVIKGNLGGINDPRNMRYDAVVQTRSLDIGTILQNRQNLGPVTATFHINGTGTDPKTADAVFNGTVHTAVLKQYTYQNLDLKGRLSNQQLTTNAFIKDPNIHFTLNATADLSQAYPAVKITGMIDSLKTQPLHWTPDPIIFRGKIDGDFASTNPDDLQGTLYLTQTLLVQNQQRLQLDSVRMIAARTDSGHSIQVSSEILNATLQGQYKLTQLGNIFEQAIQPYFAVNPGTRSITREPYDFTLNASVVNGQPLQAFLPDLTRMDSMILQSRFSSTNGWNATLTAPAIDYGANTLRGVTFKAGTGAGQDSIQADLAVAELSSGGMQFFNSTLKASLANNTIRFVTDIKDKADRSRYNFAAVFEQPQPGQYSFSFTPGGLLLNYERWDVNANNRIIITRDNLIASNFVLSKGGQQLSLNSTSQSGNAPLEAKFTDFRIATITAFVQNDSTLIDGRMNGSVTFSNIMKDPIFKGDLNIADLSVRNDTVGNATIQVNNSAPNTYVANAVISGRGNDVKINGKYYLNTTGPSTFDLDLDLAQLPMKTVEAFANGAIRSASGNTNGRFKLTGTLDKPVLRGELNFDNAAFAVTQLNNYFRVDNEKITVNETGIVFDRFVVRDSLNNPLTLDGTAVTTNLRNYKFNFNINADNFQAMNSTKKDNNLYYGQLFISTNLRVRGTDATPVIDGNLTVNEKTKMTIVLPQNEPGVVERDGVIEFVDMDAPVNDSLFLSAYDSLNTTNLTGMDLAINVTVNKEAEFNLIIDEGNGDFLNVKGEALLTGGIDPSGKLTLSGSYELEEGSYELTFNFIRRKFEIQKGSKLVWLGEPTDADVDVSAIYTANTAPLDLVKSELPEDIAVTERNTYLQKIPFQIVLNMEGKLLKPAITFDIRLPESQTYNVDNSILTTVRTKLDMLRQEPGEMNKQVFAVLLLNRFVGQNPFSSSGNLIDPNLLARQSVSKLLTEQLNRLAENLIEGVDLNFDVVSSEDYTTGERRDRTDLNVALSKRLLNDRLSVSVGSNFELEGPQNSSQSANNIAGNVAVNYRISKDGRYLLRVYRRNEYEGVIDGYVIETGVSFIISVDYNKFRQIFQSIANRRKMRDKRREQRREAREKANAEMRQAQELEKSQQPIQP